MSSSKERSEVQRAVASHWANFFDQKKTEIEGNQNDKTADSDLEVVEILDTTSDSDSEEEIEIVEQRSIKKRRKVEEDILSTPLFSSSKLEIPSPVHVFDTPKLNPPHSDSILSFFNSKLLVETYVFSFELDVDFITSTMNNRTNTKIHILAQNLYNPIKLPNINYINVKDVITNWSCHHSKLVINFYKDDTMQVFVSTSNFTPDEYAVLGGVYWKSELLLPSTTTNSNQRQEFKIDLCNYLAEYKKPQMNDLIDKIKFFDFSNVKASFVGSTPGQSFGKFGYLRLHQHLKSKNLFPTKDKNYKFLAQTSTIAGPFKCQQEKLANILTHLLLPLVMNKQFPLDPGKEALDEFMGKNNVEPMILFPNLDEIVYSKAGPQGLGCLIYNNLNKNGSIQDKFLSNFFYKRNYLERDSFVNNHSKIYLFTEDDFKTLNWCFVGSMNLSKSAWGAPSKDNSLRGNNWECGVLLDPKDFNADAKFVPTFNENKSHGNNIALRLPFKLPVRKYDEGDQLWCRFDPRFTQG